MDPFKPITDKIEEIKADVKRAVEITILRETTKFNLSRLSILDPENSQKYLDALSRLD